MLFLIYHNSPRIQGSGTRTSGEEDGDGVQGAEEAASDCSEQQSTESAHEAVGGQVVLRHRGGILLVRRRVRGLAQAPGRARQLRAGRNDGARPRLPRPAVLGKNFK